VTRWAAALGLDLTSRAPVKLVSDGAEWAITWMARHLCRGVNALHAGTAALAEDPGPLRRSVVHFGTRDLWLAARNRLDGGNRVVVTSLHGNPGDGDHFKRSLDGLLDSLPRVAAVVASNGIMSDRLLRMGIPRERLRVVPLGVDTTAFVPATEAGRAAARRAFGVPDGKFCVGSFQKDGEGWGDGLNPKLIKGPDVFVAAVARLARDLPVFVLLTGPARGYVKRRLAALGIPYAHHEIDDFGEIVRAYHALDLYLIASREEGGPLALVESMAAGVPVAATAVGMVPDVLRHGENGMVAVSEDSDSLAQHAARVLTDSGLGRMIVDRALADVRRYDWMVLARRCYDEVYAPLLRELGRQPPAPAAGRTRAGR
jgi:glycosyltransferase involved in cell wall biosynthesis